MSMERTLIIAALLLTGCSTNLIVQPVDQSRAYSAIELFEPFALIEKDTVSFSDRQLIGLLKMGNNSLTLDYDYATVLSVAKEEARKVGGNCLVITGHKQPSVANSCHRIQGKIYRIDDPQDYETSIAWDPRRKLKISDFKGDTLNQPHQAMTLSSINYFIQVNRLSRKITVKTETVFQCPLSFFKRSAEDSLILLHEQVHFDITEAYRRKLLQRFEEEITSYAELNQKHQQIFGEVMWACKRKQDEYDREVQRNKLSQAKWKDWVEEELRKMENYKMIKLDLKTTK